MSELQTIADVIGALGGPLGIRDITGMNYKAAFALKYASVFPSKYYLVMSRALEREGKSAPASLWGMREEPERETATHGHLPS